MCGHQCMLSLFQLKQKIMQIIFFAYYLKKNKQWIYPFIDFLNRRKKKYMKLKSGVFNFPEGNRKRIQKSEGLGSYVSNILN